MQLNSRNCEVKFVQESGVVRTWEVARCDQLRGVIFDFLAGSQLNKDLYACVYMCMFELLALIFTGCGCACSPFKQPIIQYNTRAADRTCRPTDFEGAIQRCSASASSCDKLFRRIMAR